MKHSLVLSSWIESKYFYRVNDYLFVAKYIIFYFIYYNVFDELKTWFLDELSVQSYIRTLV